jgi:Flp pilus assembly protein TadB
MLNASPARSRSQAAAREGMTVRTSSSRRRARPSSSEHPAGASAAGTTELLRLRVSAGAPLAGLGELSERTRRAVAVAERAGAPLLGALDGALAAEDDLARARRAVAVASAQARAVAIGLIAAPLLLVPALGRLVGADLRGFYTSPTGILVLAAGIGLLGLGAALIVVLIARVGRAGARRPRPGLVAAAVGTVAAVLVWRTLGPALAPLAGLAAHHLACRRGAGSRAAVGLDEAVDLAATALGGGVSPAEALRLAADELAPLAAGLRRLAFDLELGLAIAGATVTARSASSPNVAARARSRADAGDPFGRLAAVLTAADALGAPAVPTLRRLGADLRAEELTRVLAAAERLPAQLTFPTALCLLPATVLLVGAPIVHAGLAGVGT